MDGLMLEFGPFVPVDGGSRLELRESFAYQPYNLLFIDQPLQTGLSFYSQPPTTLTFDEVRFI